MVPKEYAKNANLRVSCKSLMKNAKVPNFTNKNTTCLLLMVSNSLNCVLAKIGLVILVAHCLRYILVYILLWKVCGFFFFDCGVFQNNFLGIQVGSMLREGRANATKNQQTVKKSNTLKARLALAEKRKAKKDIREQAIAKAKEVWRIRLSKLFNISLPDLF